jgi:hypothetical protein
MTFSDWSLHPVVMCGPGICPLSRLRSWNTIIFQSEHAIFVLDVSGCCCGLFASHNMARPTNTGLCVSLCIYPAFWVKHGNHFPGLWNVKYALPHANVRRSGGTSSMYSLPRHSGRIIPDERITQWIQWVEIPPVPVIEPWSSSLWPSHWTDRPLFTFWRTATWWRTDFVWTPLIIIRLQTLVLWEWKQTFASVSVTQNNKVTTFRRSWRAECLVLTVGGRTNGLGDVENCAVSFRMFALTSHRNEIQWSALNVGNQRWEGNSYLLYSSYVSSPSLRISLIYSASKLCKLRNVSQAPCCGSGWFHVTVQPRYHPERLAYIRPVVSVPTSGKHMSAFTLISVDKGELRFMKKRHFYCRMHTESGQERLMLWTMGNIVAQSRDRI